MQMLCALTIVLLLIDLKRHGSPVTARWDPFFFMFPVFTTANTDIFSPGAKVRARTAACVGVDTKMPYRTPARGRGRGYFPAQVPSQTPGKERTGMSPSREHFSARVPDQTPGKGIVVFLVGTTVHFPARAPKNVRG